MPRSLLGTEWTQLPTRRKLVALTFDAGSNDAGIPKILAVLRRTRVPATFFLTGRWANLYPRQAHLIGSRYPVGNHSWTHPQLPTLPDSQVREQLLRAERIIEARTGQDPRPLFRFPYGAYDRRTLGLVNGLGYGSVYWTVDTLGWEGTSMGQSVASVLARVCASLRPGAIVLMHVGSAPDNSTLDADALRPLIAEIKARGYGFTTLDQFLPLARRPTVANASAARAEVRSPTSAVTSRPSLSLSISQASIPAGGCAVATVTSAGGGDLGARVRLVGGDGPASEVRLRRGRGRVRICEGWTGRGVVGVRAVAPGVASPSRTVLLRVRPAPWMIRAQRLVGGLPVSVSVVEGSGLVYAHDGNLPRTPASNEKLLLSMALLDRFGPAYRIPTTVEGARPVNGSVEGNLWLVGHGDPELNGVAVERLARELRSAGVRAVTGAVVGVTTTFTRERWARGWDRVALEFIGLPTALTFDANAGPGGFVFDPERRAAAALTADLRRLGVRVRGPSGAGREPAGERVLASIRSAPLLEILRRQNLNSLNLDAEVLDKMLGASVFGLPGSIAKGARAIGRWARRYGVEVVTRDGSGLSYANRISTNGMVRLLAAADSEPWAAAIRSTLPTAGQGTLTGRLARLRVSAKTGTLLKEVSALSGWVWLDRSGRWAEFSVLSRGLLKGRAIALEDRVVAIIAESA